MWNNFLNELLKQIGGKLYEEGVTLGLRKLSELNGSKAASVEMATRVADQFLSALKDRSYSEATSYCAGSLIKELGSGGLKSFFSNYDLKSISWVFTAVDDSSESNKWGTLFDIILLGTIKYTKARVRSKRSRIEGTFKIRLLRQGESWTIWGFEFLTGGYSSP